MSQEKNGKDTKAASGRAEAIDILLNEHIADNRQMLQESTVNLDKIADYCVANYNQVGWLWFGDC